MMRLAKNFFRFGAVLICCWLSWLLVSTLWEWKDKTTHHRDVLVVRKTAVVERAFRFTIVDSESKDLTFFKDNQSERLGVDVVKLKLKELSLQSGSNSELQATGKLVAVQNGSGYIWKRKYGESTKDCTDLNAAYGIEDLLCLTDLPFLDKLKNPCWYEAEGGNESYPVLRCLPYFHVLGCAKCATTDLFNRLVKHPHILPNHGALKKESLWWSWKRYGIINWNTIDVKTFEDYTSLFDNTAKKIESAMKSNSKLMRKIITGDGSPPDFWDFRAWPVIPQNRGKKEPEVLTPHLMKHVYRKPKFILLLRNPTDRLYSDYFFTHYGDNPYTFHEDVVNSIWTINNCLTNHTRQHCFYSGEIFSKLRSRIHYGCYAVYLKEWFQVFSVDQFYIARMEDYSQDVDKYLADIFQFLGVYSLPQPKLDKIEAAKKKRITKSKAKAEPMQLKTRMLLDKFYEKCNEELATMLGSKKYLWSEFLGNYFSWKRKKDN